MTMAQWTKRSGTKTVAVADLANVVISCPELNADKIAAVKASGVTYAPVVVYAYSCGGVALVDGRHRLAVARELGVETLKCEVVKIRGRMLDSSCPVNTGCYF